MNGWEETGMNLAEALSSGVTSSLSGMVKTATVNVNGGHIYI